ncbi:MAG: hypothetical protein WA872_16450 [Candidatus Sulfotelmatobacter sp.]|jgi:hypothetical protein
MSANIVPWQTRFGRIVGKPEAIRKTGLGVTSAAGLVSGIALINSLPVRSNDADFFAADASKLYRQSNEAIFLFLIIGSEGILVHDDNRGVMCAAGPGKVWEDLFDNSDEVGFLPRKFRLVPVQHSQYLMAFQLKAAIPQSDPSNRVDGGFTPSNARTFRKLFSIRT